MIAEIFAAVIQQQVLEGVACHIGAEFTDYAGDEFPRMVWIPGVDTFRSGKIKTGVDGAKATELIESPFLTRVAGVKVKLWAVSNKQKSEARDDILALEHLLRRTLVAVQNVAFGNFDAGDFVWGGGDGQEIAEKGRVGTLSLTFEVPIYRTPEEAVLAEAEANVETQTGTMNFPVGPQWNDDSTKIPGLVARWRFDEANDGDVIADDFGTWPLTGFGSVPSLVVDGLVDGRARSFPGYQTSGASGPAIGASAIGNSNCTFTGWLRRSYDGSSPNGFEQAFLLGGYGADETEAANRSLSLLYRRSDGAVFVEWEFGAGVNQIFAMPGMALASDNLSHAFAVSKLIQNDGLVTVRGYVDGVLVSTVVNQPNSTGGEDSLWWIGVQQEGPSDPTPFLGIQGAVDDFRFYDRVLSPQEVLQVASPMRGPVTASPTP